MSSQIKYMKIASYNVNGILNPIKRFKILGKKRKKWVKLALLQETRLCEKEHEKLKRNGFVGGRSGLPMKRGPGFTGSGRFMAKKNIGGKGYNTDRFIWPGEKQVSKTQRTIQGLESLSTSYSQVDPPNRRCFAGKITEKIKANEPSHLGGYKPTLNLGRSNKT